MRFIISSQNPVKRKGFSLALHRFGFAKNAVIQTKSVSTRVSHQPIGWDETFRGCRERAENAFEPDSFGVGLESGIIHLNHSDHHAAFMACCIFDGKKHYYGFSSGFEIPKKAVAAVLENDLALQEALNHAGLTENKNIGKEDGFVAVVTQNRVSRTQLAEQAALMALSKIEQQKLFE